MRTESQSVFVGNATSQVRYENVQVNNEKSARKP